MAEIPSSVYVIIGSLILANIGTVVTVIYGIGKLVWWLSELNSRVKNVENKTDDKGPMMKYINAAHASIRELKQINKGV
jgi:ArsR family metal-binding transcriptional regulator